MRAIGIYLLVALSHGISLGSSFVVSEIYSNSVGKGPDKNKEWIEIVNRSGQEIIISSLGLEIYRGKKMEPVFIKNISFFGEPVLFSHYLLIAQAKNLGLNHCLKEEIIAIVMPDFSIENDQEHRICIAINDERSCFTTTKNNEAEDGVALFHDLHALNQTAWFHEPCHLVDGIFATPGLPARACLDNVNFRDQILEDCQSRVHIAPHPLENGHSPKISLVQISRQDKKTATIKLGFTDEDQDDVWWLSPCISPKTSQKICYKTDFKRMRSGMSCTFLLPTFSEENDRLYFLLNDLYGSVVPLPAPDSESTAMLSSPWRPPIVESRYDAPHVHVTLWLSLNEVPLNVSLLSADGRILDQRSFVERGEKKIIMSNDQAWGFYFSSPKGDVVLDLGSLP